jgi:hypothetical protein
MKERYFPCMEQAGVLPRDTRALLRSGRERYGG